MSSEQRITKSSVREVRRRWCEALRGVKYRQGRQYLRRTDGTFCCLGVLCDLVGGDDWQQLTGDFFTHEGLKDVWQAAGLSAEDVHQCVAWNDVKRKSFAEIADYIEQLPLPEGLEDA